MPPLWGYPLLGLPKTGEQFLPFWWITSLAFDCFSFWLIGLSFLVFGKESVTNLVEDAIAIPTTRNGPNSWLDELDAESTRRDAETKTRLHRASPQSPTVHLLSLMSQKMATENPLISKTVLYAGEGEIPVFESGSKVKSTKRHKYSLYFLSQNE